VFSITTVQPQRAAPASSALGAPLSRVTIKKTVSIATGFTVSSAPAGSPVSIAFTVKRGGTTITQKMIVSALRAPDPRGSYVAQMNATFKKTGTYVLSVSVSVNGITQTNATSFTVSKK
jgi:hypothetical protein